MDNKITTISAHAKERYAERIMQKDETLKMNQFVVTHEEKITADIKKMVEHGTLIYSGKLSGGKDKNSVLDVYIQNTWVVLVDSNTRNCVTLYKIDLGLDEEFNKRYVEGMMEKILAAKEEADKKKEEIEDKCVTYQSSIKINEDLIKEYRGYINNLESTNSSYRELCKDLKESKNQADIQVRGLVDMLIGKPKY